MTDRDDDSEVDTGDSDTSSAESTGNEEKTNVDVSDSGASEPKDPKWEKPSVDDIPEFETGGRPPSHEMQPDVTAGKPNDARTPASTRLGGADTEAYISALELCARLPDELRLPDEAADIVPTAFEAELEQEIQAFAATEFDNPTPHVETLSFIEADGDIWLKLRLGAPVETFDQLADRTVELREYALEELDSFLE
ncbi:hypothetical protein [Haloplanus salilacus]|uniref:hypothetical protein n=1 Tax=Haloplanus salilacus TaxID=2949994 RepID=UPI0030D4B187